MLLRELFTQLMLAYKTMRPMLGATAAAFQFGKCLRSHVCSRDGGVLLYDVSGDSIMLEGTWEATCLTKRP